jgi:hypothetical protein
VQLGYPRSIAINAVNAATPTWALETIYRLPTMVVTATRSIERNDGSPLDLAEVTDRLRVRRSRRTALAG